MQDYKKYIHIKEYYIGEVSEKQSVDYFYEIYIGITENADDIYDADYVDVNTVYNGKIGASPDFTDDEDEVFQSECYSNETNWYNDESVDKDESEWDLCYSSDEELDIELDKLLKQMADKTKNNGRW